MKIKNSEYQKLLEIKVDTKLNFNEHLNYIISKACRKVNALSRIMPYMSLSKKKKLVSSFFNSQFNYCPLIWMFHNRIINNEINRLHERCLRLLYGDKSSSFEKLSKINLLRYTLAICKYWLRKCSKYIEICLLPFSVRFFIAVIKIIIYESIQILHCQT